MLKRGSNIFSVSLSHNIYSFKITSAVLRDNYVHSSLDWETYPLNETRCFKHKIGIFKDLLLPLIAQRYLKTNVSCIMFWRKITKYDEILFIIEKINLKRFIILLGNSNHTCFINFKLIKSFCSTNNLIRYFYDFSFIALCAKIMKREKPIIFVGFYCGVC